MEIRLNLTTNHLKIFSEPNLTETYHCVVVYNLSLLFVFTAACLVEKHKHINFIFFC
jgi:hypothetical protein